MQELLGTVSEDATLGRRRWPEAWGTGLSGQGVRSGAVNSQGVGVGAEGPGRCKGARFHSLWEARPTDRSPNLGSFAIPERRGTS